MAHSTKKILREEYDRLKKAFEKIIRPKRQPVQPQLVLQPIRNQQEGRKYLRGTDLR
jgi:hypothetical protein